MLSPNCGYEEERREPRRLKSLEVHMQERATRDVCRDDHSFEIPG